MVTPLIPCHALLCFTSSYICRNNAILWYPPDSPAYSDALLMKALCSHCLIPQLCCAIEPGVSLLGGRIICGLDVPIEEHVAAFICALDRFESAWLSEESGSCAVSSACRDAFCIGGSDAARSEAKIGSRRICVPQIVHYRHTRDGELTVLL
jgi:hypothetical protein